MAHKHKVLVLGRSSLRCGAGRFTAAGAVAADAGGSVGTHQRAGGHGFNSAQKQRDEDRGQSAERASRYTEARLDETPTATPQPPTATPTPEPATATATATVTATATATPTQVLPTATATPATPYLTTRGRMNIRGGPGTNYAIVGAARPARGWRSRERMRAATGGASISRGRTGGSTRPL